MNKLLENILLDPEVLHYWLPILEILEGRKKWLGDDEWQRIKENILADGLRNISDRIVEEILYDKEKLVELQQDIFSISDERSYWYRRRNG